MRIQLTANKKVLLDSRVFGLEDMAMAKELMLEALEVKGISLQDGVAEAEINIDEFL